MRFDGALLAADLDRGFEAMVEAFQGPIFAFSLSLCGERTEAEEVAQETFIRAWKALRGWPPERLADLRCAAWLHRIALNAARRRAPTWAGRTDGAAPEAVDSASDPARLHQVRGDLDRLRHLLKGLPRTHREAIVLHLVQGFSYRECAHILGRKEATLRSDLRRGLERLRLQWAQEEQTS